MSRAEGTRAAKARRQQLIADLVSRRGEARLGDLEDVLDSSQVTLRRDLRDLAARGAISYERGVARARRRHTLEPSYVEKLQVAAREKDLIGREAAELVMDGDAVILGPGTTTLTLARHLRDKNIQVWTNSLLVAEALADAAPVDVHLAGGELRGSVRAVVGSRAERFFSGLRAPLAFLSGNGFSLERGLTTPNAHVADIDRVLASAALSVVALVDHTKVGLESLLTTVPPSRVARVVTDEAASPEFVQQARRAGIRVHVARSTR
ncbi:DeoR/GlpR family DNA-binding transcription regulator [Isoptericola sp. NPDC055881]